MNFGTFWMFNMPRKGVILTPKQHNCPNNSSFSTFWALAFIKKNSMVRNHIWSILQNFKNLAIGQCAQHFMTKEIQDYLNIRKKSETIYVPEIGMP